MPLLPRRTVVTNETAVGPLVITLYTREITSQIAFSIGHNHFPTNVDVTDTARLFAGGLASALGKDGRLVSERSITLHDYPGREWQLEKLSGQALVTIRTYLVDHELYQAICVMPKSSVCHNHVREFLDSFDLQRSDAR